jgi:hypothetical protein
MEKLKRYSVFSYELAPAGIHEEDVCKSKDVEALEKEVERLQKVEEEIKKVFDTLLKKIDETLEKVNGRSS